MRTRRLQSVLLSNEGPPCISTLHALHSEEFRQVGKRPPGHRQARDRRAGAARSRRAPEDRRLLSRLHAGDFATRCRRWSTSSKARSGGDANSPRSATTAWPSLPEISGPVPGFVAQTPLTAPDAGVAETERAINELGALGMQIFTNVDGKPLDRPEFEPFFAAMDKLDKPIWMHPARGAEPSRTISTRRSRSTKSGGPSAGPMRPRR